jgi:hypothetical protein
MANVLKKIFDPTIDEVVQNFTIQSWHVSQSVDALTGADDYDITISGSLVVTGSVAIHTLSNLPQNGVVLYDDVTGLLYYTASSAFAVNNFYTSSVTQSITSSTVNNTINNSTINQTIISSSVNTPAPSEYYIQYNSASTFGASADFQYIYPSQSLQQGSLTIAQGIHSHAEGKSTLSLGTYSHAEGQETHANGGASHAEGYRTSASANYSHAEGYITKALAPFSHAEGSNTQATATGSHAEGQSTLAATDYSHAEGFQTICISGNYSHAEGQQTSARGIGSHTEGLSTITTGLNAHAEGAFTLAMGNSSHAEGYQTTASANYSHTNGIGTVASGLYQHIVGSYNVSSSNASAFIVGNGTSGALRSNLVFASGSTFQVTGSVNLTQNLTVGGGYRPNTISVDPSSDPTLLVTDHVVFAAPSTSPGGSVYLPAAPVTNMQISNHEN